MNSFPVQQVVGGKNGPYFPFRNPVRETSAHLRRWSLDQKKKHTLERVASFCLHHGAASVKLNNAIRREIMKNECLLEQHSLQPAFRGGLLRRRGDQPSSENPLGVVVQFLRTLDRSWKKWWVGKFEKRVFSLAITIILLKFLLNEVESLIQYFLVLV